MKCIAITRNGTKCVRKCIQDDNRCKMHSDIVQKNGIHHTQRNELQYLHLKERRDFETEYGFDLEEDIFAYEQLIATQEIEKRELELHQLHAVQRLGFDPDAEANECSHAILKSRQLQSE